MSKKQKNILIVFLLILTLYGIAHLDSNYVHKKFSEFSLSPALKVDASADNVISYLDKHEYTNYYLRLKNNCTNAPTKTIKGPHPIYKNVFGLDHCYKISEIVLFDPIHFYLLFGGDIIYKISFDDDQNLKTYSNKIEWDGL